MSETKPIDKPTQYHMCANCDKAFACRGYIGTLGRTPVICRCPCVLRAGGHEKPYLLFYIHYRCHPPDPGL